MSLRLSRAPEIGIDERICWKCRTKRTHFSCTSCGKYRKPAGLNSSGDIVCKTCLEDENYHCPKCGEPGKPHSKTRCQACYWKDHANEVIAEGVAVLSRPWMRHAYRSFGDSLITGYGAQKASHRIPKYLAFFVSLDMRFKNAESITSRSLIKMFGSDGLRKYTVAVVYLTKEGIFPSFCQTELNHYNEITKQEKIVDQTNDRWYGTFLSQYRQHALKIQQVSLDRGNKGPVSRTITSWVSAAKAFLQYADSKGVKGLAQIETHHLDLFLEEQPGYDASLRRFIRYLNKEAKLFKPIKLEKTVATHAPHLILPQRKIDELTSRFLDPNTPAKEAIFGVFMLLYAQTSSKIIDLRMNQLGRNKEGLRTIHFYRLDVDIAPEIEPIIDRWIKERKSLSVLESEHDNKFLFPGRRHGCHLSPAAVKYYYDQWGVTADQLLASSLFQMYCNGVRHPNVPHNAFGVSKAMTGKYLDLFDAHYRDAVDFYREQEEKAVS